MLEAGTCGEGKRRGQMLKLYTYMTLYPSYLEYASYWWHFGPRWRGGEGERTAFPARLNKIGVVHQEVVRNLEVWSGDFR